MSEPSLFLTPAEVAEMFRLTETALSSQRKRGTAPGSLAVMVGGKYLYPKNLITHYLEDLASVAKNNLGLDESVAEDMFRIPPTNRRPVSVAEAAERLGIPAEKLIAQSEANVFPGALGWRPTPDGELIFGSRDIDIWNEASANQDLQDPSSAVSD